MMNLKIEILSFVNEEIHEDEKLKVIVRTAESHAPAAHKTLHCFRIKEF